LAYHRVGVHGENYGGASISIEHFRKQIAYIKKHYKVKSLHQVINHIRNNSDRGKDFVTITFDDGYRDIYTNAYPVLKKYCIPATIFLISHCTGTNTPVWWDRLAEILNTALENPDTIRKINEIFPRDIGRKFKQIYKGPLINRKKIIHLLISWFKYIEGEERDIIIRNLEEKIFRGQKFQNDKMLTLDQIEEMTESNITFGSHTITHPILTKVRGERARREIIGSKSELERKINKPVASFAYPNGEESDFDDNIKKMVKEAGFRCGCTLIRGSNSSNDDLFSLKRVWIGQFPSYVFKAKLSGIFG
jgi:peptidoglycan/xylan/chitin deacetylase (PgdA/CDA1 family)